MSGILRLESLTKGNTLKQGDKTPLKYRLFDADGEKLSVAGKSARVRLVYPDFLNIGYEKDGLTVAQDDTVTFTIDSVIPSRVYHVEIIVDDKFVFPSRADEAKFTVDKSSFGTETNIIEIVGKEVLINEVKSQVDTELQPLVTSLESAQQAETQRESAESSRVSAEEQREIDHANRSAELDGKADKVVELDDFITFQDFVGGRNLVLNTSDTEFKEITITNSTHLVPYKTELKVEQDATYVISMFVDDLPIPVSIDIGTGNEYGFLTHPQMSVLPIKPNQVNTFVVTFSNKIANYRALYLRFRSGQANNTMVRFNKLKVTKGSTVYPYTKAPEDFSEITQKDVIEYMATTLPNASDLTTKADKKQEDWITPTLLNGWVRMSGARVTAQYFKDQFGLVHIRGNISNGSGSIFQLPTGYRPASQQIFLVGAGLSNEVSKIRISTDGIITFDTSPVPTSVQLNFSFDVRS